jgi:hypothetical protein
MSQLTPPPAGTTPAQGDEAVTILAICNYVFAGLAALGGCGPLIYTGIGGVLLGVGTATTEGEGAVIVGGALLVIGIMLAILVWGLAVLWYYTGRSLQRRENRTLCMIGACVQLFFAPVGTIVGVITLYMLTRPHVAARFRS